MGEEAGAHLAPSTWGVGAEAVGQEGSKGEQVKTAQRLLKAMGYSVGLSGADGDFGAKTEKAVKKFQNDAKLDDDGIIGQRTWEALLK